MRSFADETRKVLAQRIEETLFTMNEQGYEVTDAFAKLSEAESSADALLALADEIRTLPMQADWPYEEPSDWESILASLPDPPKKKPIDPERAAAKVRTGFLSSVCGCILGKPIEFNPSLADIREGFSKVGEWPIRDYISLAALDTLGRKQLCWKTTCRETIRFAASDDDLNYSVMGMLNLEENGENFTQNQLATLWGRRLAPHFCWGPEREMLLRIGVHDPGGEVYDPEWPDWLNRGSELCGAMIRADAYGYACPGDPLRAAKMAWRDAAMTHRKNGIYGTMFAAAAIAAACTAETPAEIFEQALRCVPPKSRFAERVSRGLELVRASSDWLDGYEKIHAELHDFCHCRVYQESADMINTLFHAKDVGDGICMQVMQGNDTDSYGCTVGSILGCFFGPEGLEERWLAPFGDRIVLGMTDAPETSLSALAERMSRLPKLLG